MDDSKLTLVLIAHCGWVIPADAWPAGHAVETTWFGDVRVPV